MGAVSSGKPVEAMVRSRCLREAESATLVERDLTPDLATRNSYYGLDRVTGSTPLY